MRKQRSEERQAWRKGQLFFYATGKELSYNASYSPVAIWAKAAVSATDKAIEKMLQTAAQESGDA